MGNTWLSGFNLDSGLVATITTPAYPIVSWNLGEASWLGEVAKCDEFDLILPWPQEEITFGKGSKKTRKECYVSSSGQFCILAERTRWFDRLTNERIGGYREGSYSKLQLLVLVRDASPVPVMLTIKGVSAGELSKQLTTLRRSVMATARRKLGQPNLSEAGFWLTLRAGQSRTVGTVQTQEITPPDLELPGKGVDDLADWLGKRFVGPEVLELVNSLADEVRAWRDADADHAGHEPEDEEQPAAQVNGNSHSPKVEVVGVMVPKVEVVGVVENHPDEFDELPSASAQPAMQKVLFYSRVKTLGLESSSIARDKADRAEASGDWGAALRWLDLVSTN